MVARIFHTGVAKARSGSRENQGATRAHIANQSVTEAQRRVSLEQQANLSLQSEICGLVIQQDGARGKFVKKVAQVGFHGPSALKRGQKVLYVTERAVFELTEHGLELREVAPGVSVEKDILEKMDFRPLINSPQPMSPKHFL